MSAKYVVDFPTLGDLLDGWVRQHCVVPALHDRGKPFEYSDWQFWCTANHWRIRDGLKWTGKPLRNKAFHYRRSIIVAPQKTGKGPLAATWVAAEAVGPSQFDGWATAGDVYRCADEGCGCGWEWPYEPGEPKGTRHPSPLIQLLATSEEQVDNTYGPLRAMIQLGRLRKLLKVREGFIRIVGASDVEDLDRIDIVTAKASSRLGNPITFAIQDETSVYNTKRLRYVAETQRRGLAGMGGRSVETTNAWDPAENSVAQTTFESKSTDIFRFFEQSPTGLRYTNKRDRRKIHAAVYEGSPWVDLDSIEGEAAELLQTDPSQAERFFGNRVVADSDAFFDADTWRQREAPMVVPDGGHVALGFDGSQHDDWTALRARYIALDGSLHGFTPRFADGAPTYWNPTEHGGVIPRSEVQAAVSELFGRYQVTRLYADPELWQSELEAWAVKHGDKRVIAWATYRTRQMAAALERLKTDMATGGFTHDGCDMTEQHIKNAKTVRRDGGIVIGKPNPHRKIDLAVADTLAHEAAADSKAAGLIRKRPKMIIY